MQNHNQHNLSTDTLSQGIKFNAYQKKIIQGVAKKNKKIKEGFETKNSSANSNIQVTKNLMNQTNSIQNAAQELQQMQNEFSSLLERYQTAKTQLLTTTRTFVGKTNMKQKKNNTSNNADIYINKNVYVNTVVDKPDSQYIGAYNDNSETPAMTKINDQYTFSQCQQEAVNSGNLYFGLENSDSSGNSARCSVSNDLSDVTKYGKNMPKCSMGSDKKMYGSNLVNALYSTTGPSFLGCYNDNSSNRAMIVNGPELSTFSPVYAAGPFNMGPWNVSSSFPDPNAQWIWYTADFQTNAPNNTGSPMTLINIFNYTGTGYMNAKLYGICDNSATIYLNGQSIGTITNGWSEGGIQLPITIAPGANYISASVENQGGPAGFLMTIIDTNNTILFDTNFLWKYTSIHASQLIPDAQNFTVASCQQYAVTNGYQYFGLQNGAAGTSQCFVSNDLSKSTQYGSADSIMKGSDGSVYGKNDVNAVYKIMTPGYPANLGKAGYINEDSTVSEYPKGMISNGSILGANNSCPKELQSINSIVWEGLKKSDKFMSASSTCGLANAVQADQATVQELGKQLEDMCNKIIERIHYLEGLDSSIIQQTGINKKALDEMLTKYQSYNKQFIEYKTSEQQNISGILTDSNILVTQENYSYILWCVLAITGVIIAFTLIKKVTTKNE
uniref:Uncharacterized protein n=1 Tax=viral metagenome TaxID=1070528 RepID=A0A6C0AZY9_9ZZZZ